MTGKQKDIQDFLENIPDQFHILEEGINIQTQKEYIDYSHSFDSGELSEEDTLNLGNILFDGSRPLEAKKKVLVLLAHLGTITAFRQIEKYYKYPDEDLKHWTALALQECKMLLESTLIEESVGFISSGLGGLQDKLRYYFLVLPSSDSAFTKTQTNIIQDKITLAAKSMNCIVESVDPSETFVGLTVLVPMDIAVGTFIETGIKKCNELVGFVLEHYYVTNQNIPGRAEINDIINIVKNG